MRKSILKNYVKLGIGILFWGCTFASMSHAESEIKMWRNQTVYVPVYTHTFLEGKKRVPLNLSPNLVISNTDSVNSTQITEVIYYNSEGELLKSYLNSPKNLNPMASEYYLTETADDKGGWGASFIIKWKSANKVTQPLIEAIHSGTYHGAYIFSTRGWPIKGVYE